MLLPGPNRHFQREGALSTLPRAPRFDHRKGGERVQTPVEPRFDASTVWYIHELTRYLIKFLPLCLSVSC